MEACLIVCGAVRESNRQEAAFGNFVVHGRRDLIKGERDIDRCDVGDVQESVEIASDADVRSPID